VAGRIAAAKTTGDRFVATTTFWAPKLDRILSAASLSHEDSGHRCKGVRAGPAGAAAPEHGTKSTKPAMPAALVLPGNTSARGKAKPAARSNHTGTAGKVLQRMHRSQS
jgi:hypothetical protein